MFSRPIYHGQMNLLEKLSSNLFQTERYLSMQIDITNICNLTCKHCYHPDHKNDNALSLNEWLQIIEQYFVLISKMNFKSHIIICGGEPLASPLLFPILEYIKLKKAECEISILTNGTLVSRINLEKFKGFKKLDFQVSFDGPDVETHDYFRGKGNFEKAIAGVKKLREENFPVYLQATLTKRNSILISEFFDLASQLNASAMNFTRLIGVGFGENLFNSDDHAIKPSELKAAFEQIIINSARTGVRTDTEIPLMNLIHPTLGKRYSFGEGIVIDYQGDLLVSSRSRVKLGKVTNKNLEKLFFGNSKKRFFDKSESECFGCENFEYCGGDLNVSYAAYGDFFKKDPGCWKNIESA